MPNTPLTEEEELRLKIFVIIDDYRKESFIAGRAQDIDSVMKIDSEYEQKIIDLIRQETKKAVDDVVSGPEGNMVFYSNEDTFSDGYNMSQRLMRERSKKYLTVNTGDNNA